MPEHLEELILDQSAQDFLSELGQWLEHNGAFAAGVKNFERCTNADIANPKPIGDLLLKMVTLLNQTRGTQDVRANTRPLQYLKRHRTYPPR
jgi:hypothetical protein